LIYVTHDQVEAMTMSDRVAMMDAGKILQLGTPDELYARPANVKVAQFIGSPTINLLPARVGQGGQVELSGKPLPIRANLNAGSNVIVGIRPEALQPEIVTHTLPHRASLPVHLRRSEHLGSEKILYFGVPSVEGLTVTSRVAASVTDASLKTTSLAFDPSACHLFDGDGERIEVAAVAGGGQSASIDERFLPMGSHVS
jgi:multiple sugar transport system ATP-binding protein